MNPKTKPVLLYLEIALLAVCMALVYEILVFPNAFAPSGINGIATMLQYLFHFSLGYISLIINLPFLLIAWFIVERRFVLRTFTFTLVFSVAVLLFKQIDFSAIAYHTENGTSTVLAPMAAGVLNGLIYGVLMKSNGSTGGTDIIAACIHHYHPERNLVWTIFTLNSIVAGASYFVYGYQLEPVICCVVYSFLTSRMSDEILKGGKAAVKFEIITDHPQEISDRLIRELHHTVTLAPVTGMFSHKSKSLLICVVMKQQIVAFERIISSYPDTFAYLSSVSETVGNFKRIRRTQ